MTVKAFQDLSAATGISAYSRAAYFRFPAVISGSARVERPADLLLERLAHAAHRLGIVGTRRSWCWRNRPLTFVLEG